MILTAVVGLISSVIGGWQEEKKAKTKAKIENSQILLSGWSDEFLVLVWSYPFISMFIPSLYPYTVQAFDKISLLPEWYVGGFISISFAVFGINKLFRWKSK